MNSSGVSPVWLRPGALFLATSMHLLVFVWLPPPTGNKIVLPPPAKIELAPRAQPGQLATTDVALTQIAEITPPDAAPASMQSTDARPLLPALDTTEAKASEPVGSTGFPGDAIGRAEQEVPELDPIDLSIQAAPASGSTASVAAGLKVMPSDSGDSTNALPNPATAQEAIPAPPVLVDRARPPVPIAPSARTQPAGEAPGVSAGPLAHQSPAPAEAAHLAALDAAKAKAFESVSATSSSGNVVARVEQHVRELGPVDFPSQAAAESCTAIPGAAPEARPLATSVMPQDTLSAPPVIADPVGPLLPISPSGGSTGLAPLIAPAATVSSRQAPVANTRENQLLPQVAEFDSVDATRQAPSGVAGPVLAVPQGAAPSSAPPPPDLNPGLSAKPQVTVLEPYSSIAGKSLQDRRPSHPEGVDRIIRYVQRYDGGSCFFVVPVEVTETSAKLEGYAASAQPFERLDAAFRRESGFEATIDVRLVTPAQCPAVRLLWQLRGGNAPHLHIDSVTLRPSGALTGSVEAGEHRSIELLLVTNIGIVRNISRLLKAGPTGRTFAITLPEVEGAAAGQPQLLVAIASAHPLGALQFDRPIGSDQLLSVILAEALAANQTISAMARYFKLER